MRRVRPILALVASAALLAGGWGAVRAQEAKALAEALAALRDAAADRDLAQTERLFAALDAAGPGPDARDEAALLLGKTRMVAGRYDEAAAAVRPAVDRVESPWHVKSLYLTAEASARRREWGTAADVYARRVEWAASDLHRSETASLYREIADGAFEGAVVRDGFGRETKVPDWAVARTFYLRTRAAFDDPKTSQLVAYRIGRCSLELRDATGALAEWTRLLARGAGEWTDDALYGTALAQQSLGRMNEARATFEKVRADHGDSPFAALSLLGVGETWAGGPAPGEEELARGLAAWREFLRLHPSHARANATAWTIADTLARLGKAREAADAYRDVLRLFPDDERAPEAQNRVAEQHLAIQDFDRAIAEWRTLLQRWPNHRLWTEARTAVALAAFRKGEVAAQEKRRDEARAAFLAFLAEHPADPRAAEAQAALGDLLRDEGKFAEAVEAWRLTASKFPGSPAAPAAALRTAEAWEGPLADLEKALAAYEDLVAKWPGSNEAATARAVLVQMKGKSLDAAIARPFRTDESPAAALRLRNVARLRMKAYSVRLDEYVRRKGGLAGVGDVVVDVVKPDHEWDWSVPDFAKYRLLDRPCPLPVKGPGAWIVTAADEELTATFLVVVTDLTVIAKSAAGQALVFVADERTGTPVAGARVQLLDGGEGVTGADGVWRKDDAGAALRAVVAGQGPHAGHFAFANCGAPATQAFGYTTKAFLWTDRPVYRPGQQVRLRAIVRREVQGRYVVDADLPARVRVVDPRGAELLSREVRPDAFGAFAADLELAAEPALGTHTLFVETDGRSFQQTFDVLAYRKPDVLAEVLPARNAYLAGDRVAATATLRYTVGGVVAGAAARWTVERGPFVFDPSVHEAFSWFFRDPARDAEMRRLAEQGSELHTRGEGVTDAEGRLAIEFATDAVDVDRTYTIVVEVQDPNRRWIRTSASVPVTTRGIHLVCRTEKKVYRPGEALRLEVTAVDPLHVPVAVEGRGVLLRRRLVDQHFVEDEVASAPATTGADGRATVELRAAKAGEHVVRFVAKDARGRDVVGSATVTVSGDAEDLARQARLVADREFYREGDVAKVFVNVPVAPAPVLLTWEGERVLEHRVVVVTERSNTIDMPLRGEHAPNVFLRMAVAKGGALHEDGDEVAVFQYLDVQVVAEPSDLRPGGRVSLRVTTTDQSGRPVRAQVGVDVVDAAVHQVAPDRTPQIKPFFYDQRRTHGVSTTSSGAALPSLTRPTNKDLLFEQMRRLGRAQWEKMQEHVRLGREAIERGDTQSAATELGRALEIAPGNYEARKLLDSMREVARHADDRAKRPAAAPPAAKAGAPAERERAEDAKFSSDAPFEGPGTNGTIGVGGGAGGAFGGRRGGARKLRASGGGGPAKDDKNAEADYLESAGEELRDALEGGAPSPELKRLLAVTDLMQDEGASGAAFLRAGMRLRIASTSPVFVPAELRQRFEDTAFSSPSVRTGDDGTATVEFTLPDNLTEWRVAARGAGAGPLVGEGSTRFRTSKRLLVRPDAPRFLTQGDVTTATGTVHSSLGAEAEVAVRFTADGARIGGAAESKVRLAPGAVRPFDARVETSGHGLSTLRVEALTEVESDAATQSVPVVPHGLRSVDGASGVLVEEAVAELDLPASWVDGTQSVTVSLAPSIDVALLESLAYTGSYPWGCVEQTVNRFLPALAARIALDAAGSPNRRLKTNLEGAVDRGLAALWSLQADDGSFGWFGPRSVHDSARPGGSPEMTAYAVLGIVRAEHAGFRVSAHNRDRAVAAAANLLRGASPEHRAFLLYALSHAQAADLEQLNALHRERATLPPRALALLALAMHRTGRPANAQELAGLLASRATRESGQAWWPADRGLEAAAKVRVAFHDAEPTAYALLALLAVEPSNPLVDEAAAWLLASRRGPSWRSTRDTAAAIEALAEHARSRGVERAQCEVSVWSKDGAAPLATAVFGGPGVRPVDAPVTIEVPADALRPGRNVFVLRKKGTGRVHWSALATAVEPPPAGGSIAAGGTLFSIARDYSEWFAPPLPGEAPGERIVPGWSVVVAEKRPAGWIGRPLARAGTGDKVRVTLRVTSPVPASHVLVEDALPAGFEVVPGTAEGPFDREERRDDRQVFFVGRFSGSAQFTYVLQAIHPGDYRALPAAVRPMYEPELHAWSREHRMSVTREPGAASRAPSAEEITPDEVWALALRALGRNDWAAARGGFEGLLADHELRPEIQEEAWAHLFRIGVATDDAKLLVRAFEQMTDRNPRRAPTDVRDRRKLADAYRSLGEGERATALYRDLVRDLAADDLAAAKAPAEVGDPWRARDLVRAVLRRSPDVSWVEEIEFADARAAMDLRAPLPLAAGARAPAASEAQPFLLDEAVRGLRAFQAHHADSPLAHEAGHLAVQALLRMNLPADAIREGTRFLARHPSSRYLDDVTLLVAQGHFQAGDWDRALAASKPLLDGAFPRDDDPSRRDTSPFRAQAIHLAAKVAHLRGELARAVDLYRQVAGLFPDAADALAFLTQAGLELREVEACAVGETPQIHLRRKNVSDVELEVYAVDFMILYAVRRNLADVNRIDLSGIAPLRKWAVARRAPEDCRWNEETVDLPARERGVYLVVARGGGLDASSVVLVSDLEVGVQEVGGRLRVYTSDRRTGRPAGEVYVKVGNGAAIQAQGFTDARGVFEAPAVKGGFSVVAEKDGNVALWRR